ncbi:MAG: (Fe-S)-binding protein, partial [Chloroflexi bacterium]|nr:(Fe-S)-binding protein [Chloroflexota bacterium]
SLARALRLIPPPLRATEAILPRVPATITLTPALSLEGRGRRRGRVAFVSGCVMSTLFAETNAASVRVLSRNGFEVVIPENQICCGALAIHAGERAVAKEMARKNIDAFTLTSSPSPTGEGRGGEVVPIIINAAGCGVALKEYGDLMRDDPAYAERAKAFSARVKDITEFLVEQGIEKPTREIRARVTYQDACHLAHGQGIRAQPRALITQIPGIELVEMRDADRCCGSAGIYNITQPELSRRVLAEKMENVAATRPEIIVSANPGCLMQLQSGLARVGLNARVMHVIDLLAEAYGD